MSDTSHRYYQNSGAVPFTSTLTMLFGGIAASAALGLLFELLKFYVTHEIVQIAASVGFGALVGLAVQFSAKISHVRNPTYARFVGAMIGLFAMYAAWIWYLWILFGYQPAILQSLITQPETLLLAMQVVAAKGPWQLFDWHPTGGQLYAIWTIEALIVIAFAVALSARPNATYCEDCHRWTTKTDLLLHLPLVDAETLKADLEEERYESLFQLLGQPCDMENRFDVTAVKCARCTNANYLTVTHTWLSGHHQGQPIFQHQPIVKNLIVPHELLQALLLAEQTDGIGHSEFVAKQLSTSRSATTESAWPTEQSESEG